MREVVVLGVGMHKFGRFPDKTFGQLGSEAVINALEDSGAQWNDIQSVYASSMYFGSAWGNAIVGQLGRSGVPIFNLEAGCACGNYAFMLAYHAVAGGIFDIVCAVGAEKQPRGLINLPRFPMWQRRAGMVPGAGFHALEAQRLMHDYGLKRTHLAKVAIKSHNNAALCQYAHYPKNAGMKVEDILNARVICDPLTYFELGPTSEGAAAAILCTRQIAKKYSQKKLVSIVTCLGSSGRHNKEVPCNADPNDPNIDRELAVKVYEAASLGPKDIDVAEVEDAGVENEPYMYAALGFFKEDEVASAIDEGKTEITGSIPINTDGGHLSRGNPMGAAGLAQIAEIIWQLRGEAGPRQVPGAKTGLVQGFGEGPHSMMAIFKR